MISSRRSGSIQETEQEENGLLLFQIIKKQRSTDADAIKRMKCMAYYFETDGPAERRKLDRFEVTHERKFIKAMKKEGAIARKLYEIGFKNPYDMYMYNDGIWLPIEWKALKPPNVTFSLRTWRKKQPHQEEGLEKAFRKGARPILGIFWKQKKDVWWMMIRAEAVPRGSFLDPKIMKRVTCLKDIMNV